MVQIEADAIEQYLAEVTADFVSLLEQHTAFVKQLHENGCIDRSALKALEQLNQMLSKELERAHLTDADWLVQKAVARVKIELDRL